MFEVNGNSSSQKTTIKAVTFLNTKLDWPLAGTFQPL